MLQGFIRKLHQARVARFNSTGPNGEVSLQIGARAESIETNGITVGSSGRFSNLIDAINYRATLSHTLLVSATGSITYTAGVDSRIITLTTTALSPYLHVVGSIGVRINGAGPILTAQIIANNKLQLNVSVASTFSSVQIDVYKINRAGIAIIPGTRIEISASTSLVLPAFTTLYCPVKHGASIYYENTIGGILFGTDVTQNEIIYHNLIIGNSAHKINSAVFQMTPATTTNNVTLTRQMFSSCKLDSNSQDLIYGAAGNAPGPALDIVDCDINATYDVLSPTYWRRLNFIGNRIKVQSYGDFDTGGGDQGEPTAIVIGDNATTSDYPQIVTNVMNNSIEVEGVTAGDGYGVKATGVEVRQALPSQAKVNVIGNDITVNKNGGTSTQVAVGVRVGANVTGTNTPSITVSGNVLDIKHTAGASGVALSMDSSNATYVIQRSGNRIISGTLGANTASTAFS